MLILADDLTGAADSAAAFAVAGHRTRVVLAPVPDGEPRDDVDVLAVDTNGRALDLDTALTATTAALDACSERLHTESGLFVKIDSTLRGHIRETVEHVLARLPTRPTRVVVCPAFPQLGRTVVDGWVHVDNEPIEDGELRALFAGFPATAGLFMAAAQTDEHLAALVRSMGTNVLWVGSAGLARQLVARTSPPSIAQPEQHQTAERPVVVVGSRNQRTIEQLAQLDRSTAVVRLDPRETIGREDMAEIRSADALLLTGGQTARAVLDQLGCTEFDVLGEVEVGVPWGRATIDGRPVTLVTKAGGFGDENTLLRAVQFVSGP